MTSVCARARAAARAAQVRQQRAELLGLRALNAQLLNAADPLLLNPSRYTWPKVPPTGLPLAATSPPALIGACAGARAAGLGAAAPTDAAGGAAAASAALAPASPSALTPSPPRARAAAPLAAARPQSAFARTPTGAVSLSAQGERASGGRAAAASSPERSVSPGRLVREANLQREGSESAVGRGGGAAAAAAGVGAGASPRVFKRQAAPLGSTIEDVVVKRAGACGGGFHSGASLLERALSQRPGSAR